MKKTPRSITVNGARQERGAGCYSMTRLKRKRDSVTACNVLPYWYCAKRSAATDGFRGWDIIGSGSHAP